MPNWKDETGNKYGKWTVLKHIDNPKKNGALYLCECECGTRQEILGKRLRAGETKQCTKCQHLAHRKNYVGQRFGKLTVLPESESRLMSGKKILYHHCLCDCGNDTWVKTGNLVSGEVKSCGCLSHEYHGIELQDLTNQIFNDLTVIKYSKTENGQRLWQCKCECGNEVEVTTCNLTTGKVKSCGCRKKKTLLPGMKFGKLTVIKEIDKVASNGCNIYLCQCDCGNFNEVSGANLRNGTIKSCGCGRNLSYNEEYIANILTKLNIPFERQKSYTDLINPLAAKGRPLSYDFLVNQQYIIEYDGIQHFYPEGWDHTQKTLDMVHFRDMLKNEYCFKNHIPIIRIPYDSDYIEDDLILEKTRFLLTLNNIEEYYLKGNYNLISI